MPPAKKAGGRERGSIDELPSGALRVRVYAGQDPITGARHNLVEIIPAGPRARQEAQRARVRMLAQVDQRRQVKTAATVNQLLDRYLDVLDVDPNTLKAYRGYIENHIRPVLGQLRLAKVDGETLDSFYALLRCCRTRCRGRAGLVDHRTRGEHECDERCRPHVCRPLAPATVRQIHWILSGAFDRAVRWNWVSVTPVQSAEPPAPPKPNPDPPSPAEAARILNDAWTDPDWGLFLWLAMTVGARRGELCAIRRGHIDVEKRLLRIPSSISGSRLTMREKDTKTHQQRRLGLDEQTVALLVDHMARQDAITEQLGFTVGPEAFLFSPDPDGSRPWVPDSVTQRYSRMVARLGIKTTIHKLRHYNATELLAAGVDLRTVAGRLGHGGGGVTTLRVYAAWVESADHAAAAKISIGLPSPGGRISQ